MNINKIGVGSCLGGFQVAILTDFNLYNRQIIFHKNNTLDATKWNLIQMTFNILLQFRCSSRLSAERARPLPLSSVSKQKIACGKPSIIRIESSNQFYLLRKILEQTRWWN